MYLSFNTSSCPSVARLVTLPCSEHLLTVRILIEFRSLWSIIPVKQIIKFLLHWRTVPLSCGKHDRLLIPDAKYVTHLEGFKITIELQNKKLSLSLPLSLSLSLSLYLSIYLSLYLSLYLSFCTNEIYSLFSHYFQSSPLTYSKDLLASIMISFILCI